MYIVARCVCFFPLDRSGQWLHIIFLTTGLRSGNIFFGLRTPFSYGEGILFCCLLDCAINDLSCARSSLLRLIVYSSLPLSAIYHCLYTLTCHATNSDIIVARKYGERITSAFLADYHFLRLVYSEFHSFHSLITMMNIFLCPSSLNSLSLAV